MILLLFSRFFSRSWRSWSRWSKSFSGVKNRHYNINILFIYSEQNDRFGIHFDQNDLDHRDPWQNVAKREAAKMVITELFTSAQLPFPDDIVDSLSHLDDEQTDPRVVVITRMSTSVRCSATSLSVSLPPTAL